MFATVPSRLLVRAALVALALVPGLALAQQPSAGTYRIGHQATGLCLDVPGFAKGDGALLQGYACKTTGYLGNQQLTVEPVTGGFRLRVRDSQRCLDLPGGSTADGTALQQYACHNGQNQVWQTVASGMGTVQLTSRLDASKCMYLDGSRRLRLGRCATLGAAATRFALRATKTHYQVRLATGGQCLDMPGHTTADNAVPIVGACKSTDTLNQEWTFEPEVGGVMRLRGKHSGKCLDVGTSTADGTTVRQLPCSAATSQRWRLLVEPNDVFKVQSVATNKCFDYYGGALRQYTCSSAYDSQRYTLRPGPSGGATEMTDGGSPDAPMTGPGGLWARDSALVAPTLVDVDYRDNAFTLRWHDTNPSPQGYVLIVSEQLPGNAWGTNNDYRLAGDRRALWINSFSGRALVPGARYSICLMSMSAFGVSPALLFDDIISTAAVRIGNPATGATFSPRVLDTFAMVDDDHDGVVDGATGGAGAFPRFPGASGGSTVALAGARFDTAGGLRANVIIGHRLDEGGRQTFVALHLFVDPTTGGGTVISVLYGDLDTTPGTKVHVAPVGVGSLTVVPGDLALGLPNTVTGTVTAAATASDAQVRVIDFDFQVALDAR